MRNVNLSALGVPLSEQAKVPTIDTMPLKFSPLTEKLWREAVGRVSQTDPKKAWQQAIDEFLKLCSRDGMYAFHQQQSANDEIIGLLIKARREVVRFIEKFQINQQFRTRQTERSVTLTPTGFVLRAAGKSDIIAKTPDVLNDSIARMGLRGTSTAWCNIWSRDLAPGLKFFIANEGPNVPARWWYGYEIKIDIFPSIAGKPTASTRELEKFILDYLYMPILRAYRPLGLQHRLV